MKTLLVIVSAAAVFLFAGATANGQIGEPKKEQTPVITPTINLTVEQGHIIKEILLKDGNAQKLPANVDISMGLVPQTITTHSFPPEVSGKVPQVKSHTFFVKDNKVVIVDPKNNTIADII